MLTKHPCTNDILRSFNVPRTVELTIASDHDIRSPDTHTVSIDLIC